MEQAACFPRSSRGMSLLVDDASDAIPIFPILDQGSMDVVLTQHGASKWAKAQGFKGKPGETLYIPSVDDKTDKVLIVVDRKGPEWVGWQFASLGKLPPGTYKISTEEKDCDLDSLALGFLLGTYSFDRYKTKKDEKEPVRLVWPSLCDRKLVQAVSEMIFLSRDLISTPAEDMGPQHVIAEARAVAAAHPGTSNINISRGEDLLTAGYPAIHTVGRASSRPPALIDLRWAGRRYDQTLIRMAE